MTSHRLKSDHLDYLNSQFPRYVTVEEISQACSCSLESTHALLNEILSDDMPLQFHKETYRMSNPIMSKSTIQDMMDTTSLGREVLLLQSTASTNDYIKQQMDHFNNGTLVLAHEQTVGKGRLGRAWSSPAGKTIAMSLLLKPSNKQLNYAILTQLTAAALVKSLSSYVDAEIKWPNDVLVHKKKIAGILTEAEYAGQQLEGIIVGIGINTNLNLEDIPDELQEKASSLKIETGLVDPNLIISRFLDFFEHFYSNWLKDQHTKPFLDICRTHSALIGKEFWIESEKTRRKAFIDGINADGSLIVTYLDNKETTHLVSTHYSIRSDRGYI